jgi:hypothetical protein
MFEIQLKESEDIKSNGPFQASNPHCGGSHGVLARLNRAEFFSITSQLRVISLIDRFVEFLVEWIGKS